MISVEDYKDFLEKLIPILDDSYAPEMTQEQYETGKYYACKGMWEPLREYAYFYETEKVKLHTDTLLDLCQAFPKKSLPNEADSEMILSIKLLPETFGENPEAQADEELQQMIFSEHFANLLCAAGIAAVTQFPMGETMGFAIVPQVEYRSYFKENSCPFTEEELRCYLNH